MLGCDDMVLAGTPEENFCRCGDSGYTMSTASLGDASDSEDKDDAVVSDESEAVRTVLGADGLLEGEAETVCQTAMASSTRSGLDCHPLPKPYDLGRKA